MANASALLPLEDAARARAIRSSCASAVRPASSTAAAAIRHRAVLRTCCPTEGRPNEAPRVLHMLIPLMNLDPGPELRTGAAQVFDGCRWHGIVAAFLAVGERFPQPLERRQAEDSSAAEQAVRVL